MNGKIKDLLAVECKWKANVNAVKIVEQLVEKLSFVDWFKGECKEILAIFAKSFNKRIKEF